jgi:hypothetical protein
MAGDPTTAFFTEKPKPTPEEMIERDPQADFFKEVVKNVYALDNPATKSDLTPAQIPAMARGYAVAELYDIPVLKQYIDNILILSFSKNRKSREEFTRIATAVQTPTMPEEERPTLATRLFGATHG